MVKKFSGIKGSLDFTGVGHLWVLWTMLLYRHLECKYVLWGGVGDPSKQPVKGAGDTITAMYIGGTGSMTEKVEKTSRGGSRTKSTRETLSRANKGVHLNWLVV